MKVSSLTLVVGLLLASPLAASASEMMGPAGARYTLSFTRNYTPSPWTVEEGYLHRAKDKLAFGGKNTLLGWMELYNEPRDMHRQQGSMLKGFGYGMANMLGDTVGGAVHLLTFPITAVDVPLPEGGTDVL